MGLTENSDESYMGYERWLPSPPKVEKPQSAYNAASLAYIGDCIYEVLSSHLVLGCCGSNLNCMHPSLSMFAKSR